MDAAYDHITEENLSPDDKPREERSEDAGSLKTEFQEAYKSITASPWGARLGGFLGNVRKQGESYYQGAKKEAAEISDEAKKIGDEAFKGFTDLKITLVSHARSLSLEGQDGVAPSDVAKQAGSTATSSTEASHSSNPHPDSESLRESESLITRFRSEAAKRLKDIEKAEDAADEALLKFGTNIRNFLRDAVSVTPPTGSDDKNGTGAGSILFESKDADGKRVFHTTRFDAQLHVIHSSLDSFLRDPVSPEYASWAASFNVESRTADISADLEKYEELRRAMEKLVPEKVEYGPFWKRYYFLRMVVESEEARRKEMLSRESCSSPWCQTAQSLPTDMTSPTNTS